MDLIERYLHAVEFWLPTKQRQDILAELSEDIQLQMEERRRPLGRDLNEDEIVALLKERGRPMFVANRFQPKRYLIGPDLFPIYWFVLKVVSFFYLVPGFVVFSVIYHWQHGGTSWARALRVTGNSTWSTALTVVGVVTMIFAGLQVSGIAERALKNWSPRKLLTVKDRNKISRATSVTNIVASVIFLLWWVSCFSSPEILRGPSIYLTLKPVWMYFYWGFLVRSVFHIGLSVVNLLHPHWTRLRASWHLAINLVGGLLFCWMTLAHVIASVSIESVGAAKSAVLAYTMDHFVLTVPFPIVLIITVVVFIVDLLRVRRAGEQRQPHAVVSFKGSLFG
jgi:hypothetical protein